MLCTRELKPSSPLTRIKRGIEQLKFYQINENETPAEVAFSVYKDGRKWFYGIYRFSTKFTISFNFEGGCSQSVEQINNLDLDDLFTHLEKMDLSSAQDIQFNPPSKIYTWFDALLSDLSSNNKRF